MSTALDFLCGLAAGWSQILTGQPLDFIKTKYQLSPNKNVSVLQFAKQIVRDHGIRGFYRGSSSLFFGFSFTIAIEFAIYQWCKKHLMTTHKDTVGRIPQQVLSIYEIMASGGLVGLAVGFIYCPVEYAKIQKQIATASTQSSLSILIRQLYQHKFTNIYRGLTATLLRQTIGSAIYYASYENAVRQICQLKDCPRRFAQYSYYLAAGAIAGLSFWAVAYPLDVVKTKMQAGQPVSEIVRGLWRSAYRGFGVIAVRAVIVNGVSFATFQQFKHATLMLSSIAVA